MVRIESLEVTLSDSSLGDNPGLLDAEAQRLKDEIRLSCPVDVKSAYSSSPIRGRPVDVPVVGTLIVALPLSGQIISKVLELVQTWLEYRPTRKVKLQYGDRKIEIEGIGAHDMSRIVARIVQEQEFGTRGILDEGHVAEED